MKTTRLGICLLLAAFVSIASVGCMRIAKEGVGAARGAKGLYTPIQRISSSMGDRPLRIYKHFELAQITDDFGGKVPPDFWMPFRQAFREELAEKQLPNYSTGKTLLIRGKILHYEDSSRLGAAISPLEEVIARIELVDKDSGNIIGTANCIGRTTESVNLGVARKAQGLAKAIVSWLAERYPEQIED